VTERFTLLEKIGRGGMGVVWRARDEETGQIVALKLLHSAYSDDPDYVTRFERELELARRIKSPNVVGVIGYGVREGTPYLALEYVDGKSLRERLASRGPYTWQETKPLLAQIAQGLADAHAAGVVHRDIKPSNILIGSDGVAKIADFGIARGLDLTRVTGTSTLLGTPAYLPPEGPQDERSDLYSLGIVAYELLAGVPPFEGSTYAEVIMAHVRIPPDL
jgi:serine/threonine-protein kinase